MKITLSPLVNNLVIERLPQHNEAKTSSGIIVSGSTSEQETCIGKVLEIGPDVFDLIEVQPGDIVVYDKFAARPVNYNRDGLTSLDIVASTDILAVDTYE